MDADQDGCGNSSGSEWEYEYDATETETYYVTIDLTDQTRQTVSDFAEAARKDSAGTDKERTAADGQAAASTHASATAAPQPFLRAFDLASANPLIHRDGQLFSCTWRETAGTDIVVAAAETALPYEPVYADNHVKIAAQSRIRLVGVPAKLVPKTAASPTPPPAASTPVPAGVAGPPPPVTPANVLCASASADEPGPAHASASAASHAIPPALDQPAQSSTAVTTSSQLQQQAPTFSIPAPTTASRERLAQKAFLEKLVLAKARRGETDRVFLGRGRSYADCESNTPEMWNRGDGLDLPQSATAALRPNTPTSKRARGLGPKSKARSRESLSASQDVEMAHGTDLGREGAVEGGGSDDDGGMAVDRVELATDQSAADRPIGEKSSGITKGKGKGKEKETAAARESLMGPVSFVFDDPARRWITQNSTEGNSQTGEALGLTIQSVAEAGVKEMDDHPMQDEG